MIPFEIVDILFNELSFKWILQCCNASLQNRVEKRIIIHFDKELKTTRASTANHHFFNEGLGKIPLVPDTNQDLEHN